jgi:hypothetical protein
MDTHDTPRQDKQITVAVPEDRVPEFYAFYGHFLAGRSGGRGRRGPGRHGHGRCGHRGEQAPAEAQPATEAQEA